MLASGQRLRSSRSFGYVVRRGRRAGTPTLVVHAVLGSEDGESQMGLIVSKSVGGSVVRNRVKRRLRALVRPRLAALPAGSLLVVRALPASAGASSAGLAADLDQALGRVQAS